MKLVTTNTMDLLQSYESDESSSEEQGKSLSEDSLLKSDLRSVYLVTYSQADILLNFQPGKISPQQLCPHFLKAKWELFSGVAVGRNIRTVVSIIISH